MRGNETSLSSRGRTASLFGGQFWVRVCALLLSELVTLGKAAGSPGPQFPHPLEGGL